jgi:hypothetical protein
VQAAGHCRITGHTTLTTTMNIANSHLTYCTNIHAGENWPDHFAALQKHFPAIKAQVSPGQPMGIGLRLSNMASVALEQEQQLTLFKAWLRQNGAYVFTMNGFPYGGFHHTKVKDQVHAPDWTTRERVDYTNRLFRMLAALVPEGMTGGISTSPLSYKGWHTTAEDQAGAKKRATQHILEVAATLISLQRSTGTVMHLDIEPEPDGLLETGEEFIDWYEQDLLPAGKQWLAAQLGIPAHTAEELIKKHICLCYDVCHFAIGYEPHEEMIHKLTGKGIRVGKIQISAALQASLPSSAAARLPIKEAFAVFDESTYLHQVVARCSDGVIRYPDLPQALADYTNIQALEWRAHFHVPVFLQDLGVLQTTQADIIRVLQLHNRDPFTEHLEVETYTWEVLPPALKLDIGPSIIRELDWVKTQLL